MCQSDAEKRMHVSVTSRSDYCNSLLLGCPKNYLKNLQLIQSAAVRVLMRTSRRDHVSPDLASLHWLLVEFRIGGWIEVKFRCIMLVSLARLFSLNWHFIGLIWNVMNWI